MTFYIYFFDKCLHNYTIISLGQSLSSIANYNPSIPFISILFSWSNKCITGYYLLLIANHNAHICISLLIIFYSFDKSFTISYLPILAAIIKAVIPLIFYYFIYFNNNFALSIAPL